MHELRPERAAIPAPNARSARARLAVLLLVVGAVAVSGLDNGLALTPPRGWRSWNAYDCMSPGTIITDAAMRGAIRAVLDRSRAVRGKATSLKDLGFGWVSMDDGWQQCNCSTRQDEDPTLPNCSIAQCFSGGCTWHDATGAPKVNLRRFPDMKALVDYGHGLGVKVGGYLNTCICAEARSVPTHYEQDVEWFTSVGFDEVKIDNCGTSTNVSRFAELFNASGKPIRIENCHNSAPNPERPQDCPMNMYRSGGDINANILDIVVEAFSTVSYSDLPEPLSRPGCWAYPDMMEIGNFRNEEEHMRNHEERSHFGLWCVISAPLILGFNMSDAGTMDRVWPTITNLDALAVNEAWAGSPGTLVKSYPAVGVDVSQIGQRPCIPDASTLGWQLHDGRLIAPGSRPDDMWCADPATNLQLLCPPPTSGSGHIDCGLLIVNCSKAHGAWEFDAATKVMRWQPSNPRDKALCMSATPQELTLFTSSSEGPREPAEAFELFGLWPSMRELRVGNGRRVAATTRLQDCPPLGQAPPPTSTFDLDAAGRLRVGAGAHPADDEAVCLSRTAINGVQLWSKPLPGGAAAIFVLNILAVPQALAIPLTDVPTLGYHAGHACAGRDVWAERDLATNEDHLDVSLDAHESAFYTLSCGKAAGGVAAVVQI